MYGIELEGKGSECGGVREGGAGRGYSFHGKRRGLAFCCRKKKVFKGNRQNKNRGLIQYILGRPLYCSASRMYEYMNTGRVTVISLIFLSVSQLFFSFSFTEFSSLLSLTYSSGVMRCVPEKKRRHDTD